MYTQIKTSGGINLVPIETTLLSSRTIFLEGEINHESACALIRQIMVLAAENAKQPIRLLINSPGGEISAGMLLYDAIQSCPAPIQLYCLGRAYSMAAVLFASGQHGRYILPNSEVMLHEPLLGNRISGNASSLKSISDSLLETRRKMNSLLAKLTGKTEDEIAEATGYDHYFNAQESVDFGLADKIVKFDTILK